MKATTFEWLWEQVTDSIKNIENSLSKIVMSDGKSAVDSYRFVRTYGDRTKEIIKREYDKIRTKLKSQCYDTDHDENGEENRIDQHKIAACFCQTLLHKKVFSFEISQDTPVPMLLSNYELAYTVSLRIVYFYLIESYLNDGNEAIAYKLVEQKTLMVPRTSSSHDEYNIGRIKTLALNDSYGLELDLLTYADMMYWIEFYNRLLLEGRISPGD